MELLGYLHMDATCSGLMMMMMMLHVFQPHQADQMSGPGKILRMQALTNLATPMRASPYPCSTWPAPVDRWGRSTRICCPRGRWRLHCRDAHLVVCCQLRRLLCKLGVEEVQGHVVTGGVSISQIFLKAHAVIPRNDGLSLKRLSQVGAGPFLPGWPAGDLHTKLCLDLPDSEQ